MDFSCYSQNSKNSTFYVWGDALGCIMSLSFSFIWHYQYQNKVIIWTQLNKRDIQSILIEIGKHALLGNRPSEVCGVFHTLFLHLRVFRETNFCLESEDVPSINPLQISNISLMQIGMLSQLLKKYAPVWMLGTSTQEQYYYYNKVFCIKE